MTAKQIKKSLHDQLRANAADIDAFRALIDDYVAMYEISEKLKTDIRQRGTIVTETGAAGQKITKCNPSIKELRDTNKSMLTILRQLGLSIDTVKTASEDDEL